MTRGTQLAVAMGTLLSGVALAQDTAAADLSPYLDPSQLHGFEIGLRVGYAVPLGDLSSGRALADFAKAMVPLQLDLGYRFDPRWLAGAYFQFGFVPLEDGACGSTDCSAKDLRFGIKGQYHLAPTATFDPWVGLGAGYEIMPVSRSAGGASASTTLSGFEFVNLSVGADYKIAPVLGVGPYVGLSVGQYSSSGDAGDIAEKGVHMWLSFGLRSVFDVM